MTIVWFSELKGLMQKITRKHDLVLSKLKKKKKKKKKKKDFTRKIIDNTVKDYPQHTLPGSFS